MGAQCNFVHSNFDKRDHKFLLQSFLVPATAAAAAASASVLMLAMLLKNCAVEMKLIAKATRKFHSFHFSNIVLLVVCSGSGSCT